MANEPRLTYVTIDGVDVSDYVISWTLSETLEQLFRTGSIALKNTFSNVLTYEESALQGKLVEIYRGVTLPNEQKVFKGYVRRIEEERGIVRVTIEDVLSVTKYLVINRSFDWNTNAEAGVISEMFKTLINEYTGLTADNTSVVNSGTVNIFRKFRFRQRVLVDGLQELASALNWQFYYDIVADKVVFEPKGYRESTKQLSVGVEILRVPKWDFDGTDLFNKITAIGQPQEVIKEEGPILLNGSTVGWNTTSVTLASIPIAVQVFADTSATPTTERRAGVPGSTLAYDYSVDKFTSQIIWNTATYAPTTGTYVKVRYTTQESITVTRKNQASVDAYTAGEPKWVTRTKEDLQTKDDAALWAQSQLSIYSTPFTNLTNVPVNAGEPLTVGIMYSLIDNIQGYSFSLQLKEYEMSYPYRYDTCTFTDKVKRLSDYDIDTGQRLRKLEEQQVEGTELITTINDYANEIDIGPRFIEKYYRQTGGSTRMDRELSTDSMDNARMGPQALYDSLWDQVVWSEDGSQANAGYWQETNNFPIQFVFRWPGNNYYEEFVRDTYFYDAAASTGVTWNTTTNTISLTGELVSKAIVYGSSVRAVFVTLGAVTGDYEFYVSGDGKATWQAITNFGTRVLLTSTNTSGLHYKVVAASGTVTLTNTYKVGGEINMGAINIFVEEA